MRRPPKVSSCIAYLVRFMPVSSQKAAQLQREEAIRSICPFEGVEKEVFVTPRQQREFLRAQAVRVEARSRPVPAVNGNGALKMNGNGVADRILARMRERTASQCRANGTHKNVSRSETVVLPVRQHYVIRVIGGTSIRRGMTRTRYCLR